MSILNLLKISLINLFYLIGGFVGFGLLFDRIERINNNLICSTFGRAGIIITGFIGTVVHELSHLIMCLIFRHKITEVSLFRPISGQLDGVLGYVGHSYNKNSLYQSMGNFFIGIAPLIGGTVVIVFLFKLLLPSMYKEVIANISINDYIKHINNFELITTFKIFINDILFVIKKMFWNKDMFSFNYIVFLFAMYSISTHMSLSNADLKGSLSGIAIIFILITTTTLLLSLLGVENLIISSFLIKYNIFIMLFMLIGLFFLLITLGISYILSVLL